MKKQGRFIAIMAALGLLLAMLPAAPAAAEQGDVNLDETGYTAVGGSNVVAFTVDDDDLNVARVGTARFVINADTSTFDLTAAGAILEGEVEVVETFTATAGQTTFIFAQTGRDVDGDGAMDTDSTPTDDITVVVEGDTLSGAGDYTVNFGTSTVVLADASTVDDRVVITYEISEYDQATPGDTPVRLFGSSVKYGTDFTSATSSKTIDGIDNAGGTISTISAVLGSGSDDSVIIEFVYDAEDTTDFDDAGDLTATIKLKSTSDTSGIDLTGTEIDESDSDFIGEAALVDEDVNETITNTITTGPIATTSDISVLVTALDNRSAAADDEWDLASTWVTDTVGALTYLDTASSIAALQAITLEVADGDTITISYDDQSNAVDTDTASIDLGAPDITGVGPSDDEFTNDETPALTATVVDLDAGLDVSTILADGRIVILVNGKDVTVDVSIDAIADGFDMDYIASTGEVGEGANTWSIEVTDVLGNVAIETAAFKIDTVTPALDSAVTGIGLMLDEDDDDNDDETDDYVEFEDPRWIKLTFSEAIESDSVQTSDFDVVGSSEPDAVMTSDGGHIADSAGTEYQDDIPLTFVYLMVDDLDADATPTVEVIDDIDDLAGNDLDEAEEEADDLIAPTLSLSVSDDLGADEAEVAISLTSDEALKLSTVEVIVTNEETAAVSAVTMVKGSGNSWTGEFEIGDSTVYTVKANGADTSDNVADEEDAEFEGDEDAPRLDFKDATGADLDDGEVEEGAVWIIAVFDDDEYADDSYTQVTVTAVSLEDEDGNVISDDVTELFSEDEIEWTLAVDLTPGDYTVEVTGEDEIGNEVTASADFEVIEKIPFNLDLKPGVNLISLPGTPLADGGNINVLFEDAPVTTVVAYDRASDVAGENPWMTSVKDDETGLFTGDIAILEPGKAYFVTSPASTTVEVVIQAAGVAVPPMIQVYQGFNALGFWSIADEVDADADSYLNSIVWTVAYSFDPTPGIGWMVIRPDGGDVLEAGLGYFVYVSQDDTLTP